MDKTEPTFVPEWLIVQSFAIVDDKSASKSSRNKSLDDDLGSPTSSSYSRNPYSGFGRNLDRDQDSNKEKTENRFRDYSDSLANLLPSWFEKDGVKRSHRSHSNVSAKRVELSPKKPAAEKMGCDNESDPFQRDFPFLGSEEEQMDFVVVRVPSPVMVETNGPTSISETTNVTAGKNMVETLAQGSYPKTAHQSTVGSQRLEELAVKQSRQLSPTDGGKLPNSPLAAPLDHKAFSSPEAKRRNYFFNLMRKKFMGNKSPSSVSPDTESVDDKGGEGGVRLYSEEEEARLLRSLGWEESGEEGGLTDEEINSFLSKYVNSRMGFKGRQLRCLMPIILQMGKNGDDTKVDS